MVEKFADEKRFAGLGIYDNKNNVIALSSTIHEASSAAFWHESPITTR